MKIGISILAAIVAALSALASPLSVLAAGAETPRETITPAFRYPIANVPGTSLTAIIVDYPPGGKTPEHLHGSAFVVGYVLSGAIRSKIDDGKEQVFQAGESWTETPGVHHRMSENASKTEPAKMMAFFVSDTKEQDLVQFGKKK